MDFAHAAKILGLKGGELYTDIKKKYKIFVLKYHPDRYQTESEKKQAEKRFKEINEAYRYIMDNVEECFDTNAKKKRTQNPLKFDDDFYERNSKIERILNQTEEMQRNRKAYSQYKKVLEEQYSFEKKEDNYFSNYFENCDDSDDYGNDTDYEDYYGDEMPQTIYEETVIRKSNTEKIFEILGAIILGIFYLFLRAINNELDKE